MAAKFSVELSELELAFKRVKNDRPHSCFIEYPYLIDWANIDKQQWLEELQAKIALGFQPHSSRLCWVPKAHSLVRPANILHLKDEIVYNLLIGRMYQIFWSALQPWQGKPDSAYILSKPEEEKWIQNRFMAWDNFRANSLKLLEEGTQFVVVSDITGFYENIDIDKLLSDIRQAAGGTLAEIDLLRLCLRKWSARGDKGIPQGYSASHILAKIYANSIDISLRNDGYKHVRYVDDIRIFCESRQHARKAILDLSKHVHKRGLNLQSAKTNILPKNKAATIFEGVLPILEGIRDELLEEIRDEIRDESPYPDPYHIRKLLRLRRELPSEVLERAFKEYFAASNPATDFDKTLFHFLLNRLGEAKSKVAVNYCLDALSERVEETAFILKYFSEIELDDSHEQAIAKYLNSNNSIYDYQSYQIVKWFFDIGKNNSAILSYCRGVARDYNRDIWLRSYSLAYLGKYGDISDLQFIEGLYATFSNDIERADCVMALSKVETARRNAFYASIANDSPLVERAVKLIKSKK